MKMAGAGRILLWNGGSLWIGSSGGATDLHSHHAVQVSLSLSGDGLRLRAAAGDWSTYKAAVIAANQEHAFDGGGNFVANVFVEPESRDGQILQEGCLGHDVYTIAGDTLTNETAALIAALPEHRQRCRAHCRRACRDRTAHRDDGTSPRDTRSTAIQID